MPLFLGKVTIMIMMMITMMIMTSADALGPPSCDCPQSIQVIMGAVDPVFPPQTRALLNVPGTCQHWARDFVAKGQGDMAVVNNTDVMTVERIRQRVALAILYCELHGDNWWLTQQAKQTQQAIKNGTHHTLSMIDQGWKRFADPDTHECEWGNPTQTYPCGYAGTYTKLRLFGLQAVGTIPPELSLLSDLRELDLSDNQLRGTIPTDLVKLSELAILRLASNRLDQTPIPSFVWMYEDLEHLDLSYNLFSGSIPERIPSTAPLLRDLILSHNSINGSFPTTLGMSSWTRLHLDNNLITGSVPNDINSGIMRQLWLHNNRLQGSFPSTSFANEWSGDTSSLKSVKLFGNNFSGDVSEMCRLMTQEYGVLQEFAVDLDKIACECCTSGYVEHELATFGIAGWFDNTTCATTPQGTCPDFSDHHPTRSVLPLDVTGEKLCYINPADPNGNYVHWLGPADPLQITTQVYTVVWPSPLPSPSFVSTSCTLDGLCPCEEIEHLRQGWKEATDVSEWCLDGYVCHVHPLELNESRTCVASHSLEVGQEQKICIMNAVFKKTAIDNDIDPFAPPVPMSSPCFETKEELKLALRILLVDWDFAKALRSYSPIQYWCVSKLEDFADIACFGEIDQDDEYRSCNGLPTFSFWFRENFDYWDMSNAKNLTRMFSGLGDPHGLERWNVSSVTTMRGMFRNSWFNEDISEWQTGRVVDMNSMFRWCEFNQPINDWDVSRVTDMGGLFWGSVVFNQPLACWDTSRVTDMSWMFASALSFNQPIGNWNLSSVESMDLFFYNWLDHHPSQFHFSQDLCGWRETLRSGVFSGDFTGTACPTTAAPNFTETPPGPFCFPCNDTTYAIGPICPTRSPTEFPTFRPTDSPTSLPTSLPTQGSPFTSTPTRLPTLPPTSTPLNRPADELMDNSTGFTFTGITIQLQGARQLDEQSRRVFEEETEKLYLSAYSSSLLTNQRLLVEGTIIVLETTVKTTGDELTTQENTITYDQSIRIVMAGESDTEVDERVAREVLREPFTNPEQVKDYLSALAQADTDFATVTAAAVPNLPATTDDTRTNETNSSSEGLELFVVILIAVGGLLVFLCMGSAAYILYKRQGNSRDENIDEDHYLDPEGPLDSTAQKTEYPIEDESYFDEHDP